MPMLHPLLRPRAGTTRAVAAVTGVTLALALTACAGGDTSVPPATATVSRATLSASVAGTGSLAAASSTNLGFPAGGQLDSVKVQVGDRVRAGQVLATLDDFTLRQLLAQQEANLAQQKAVLGKLRHSPTLSGARATLGQARQILSATRGQVSATARADAVAIDRAQAQLGAAQDVASAAEDALSAAQAACTSPPCASVATAQAALASARAGVETARTGVATAGQKRQADAAAGQVSIQSSKQAVVTADNSADSLASDRPFGIEQQEAVVASARALVDLARHNLAAATLKAPADGTVTAINGAVGEYLTASTGTTAAAPGSDAAIPGTTANTTNSAITRPGGAQFMVLAGTGPLTAVVPLSELDAAAVTAGQPATLGVDALPDLALTGTVVAISPAGTAVSASMTYYVTLRLEGGDDRLKEGLSVHASIATEEHDQVLAVPNAAVHAQDGSSVVVVLAADGSQRTVAFQPGLVGADSTEVLSGLTEGDTVLVGGSTR
jgi:HlyD family secretion protein